MSPSTADVSIVIPNLHSPYLGQVLDALQAQTLQPAEVIVIGMDKHGFADARPWVRHVRTEQPTPQAIARNIGVSSAAHPVIAFLDSDCVPERGWLSALRKALSQGNVDNTVVCGAIRLFARPYWPAVDTLAHFGTHSQFVAAGPRDYVLSGNMMLPRATFSATAGFRAEVNGLEDTEMSFRLREAGRDLRFEPTAIVDHLGTRPSARAVWVHMRAYGIIWRRVYALHPELVGHSLVISVGQRSRLLALPLSLAATLRDIKRIIAPQPAFLRTHPELLPGLLWARLAWYAGILSHDIAR